MIEGVTWILEVLPMRIGHSLRGENLFFIEIIFQILCQGLAWHLLLDKQQEVSTHVLSLFKVYRSPAEESLNLRRAARVVMATSPESQGRRAFYEDRAREPVVIVSWVQEEFLLGKSAK